MNTTKAEILLLAPDLLGESLALQLTSEVPSWAIALRSDDLNRHPQLVIWALDSAESIALLHQELIRLQEHWQPAPVLLLLPASVPIPGVDLLSLDSPGLLQAPDLNTLREAIKTLLQGGRVVRLAQANPSTPPPQPAMGLGQWLLISGLQQITNDLQVIDALLVPPPDNLLLRLMLEGRQRELQSARSLLLLLWGPLQMGLADVQPLGQRQTTVSQTEDLTIDGNGMAITVRERNAIAVWSSIQERLSRAVDAGLNNGTGSLLAIEGLQPERRRDLLLSLLQQLDQVMARLRAPSVSSDSSKNLPIDAQWDSLQPELRRQAIQAMAGSYVHLPRGDQMKPVAQHLINASDLSQNDQDLPDPRRMLEPLLRDQPVLVNGQLLPADHPKALLQLETLVSNWLVRSAELISAELLGLCGDWPELRRYLLNERLLPTRDLERLRNQLNNQSRWQLWVKRPVQLYESQRLLYQLRGGSIAPLLLIEPRDEELRRLGWWQQQVALLLEARDALAPQVQALVQRIGDLMVVVLTQVIGRAIGLVGRGIAQGMGRSWQRSSTNRG